MLKQKLIGIALILIGVLGFVMALHGDPGDRDITVVLLIAPLGAYLLTSKNEIIN